MVADGELTTLTAIEAAERIASGDISAEEYTGACLDRIAAIEGKVHAFVHLDPNEALAQARALDERRRNGQTIGPLHGIPVAIKDIFDTADYKTECGSPLLKGRQPMRDATAVSRLRAAGAVIIGKTVTTEFAYFHPGPTRNPHDLERTPGGSSSGSAAAVAAGMVPLAIGSQTNGSMIRPAAFCGVYGVKPTHGTISRHGALMLSQALDHVGVFARSLADSALILEVLAGYDADDPDTRPLAAPAFLETLAGEPPLPPRFAFVRTPVWDKADAETRAAFEALASRLGDAAVNRSICRSLRRGLGRPACHHGGRHGAQSQRSGRARRRSVVEQDIARFPGRRPQGERGALSGSARRGAPLRRRLRRDFQGIRRHHHAGDDRRRAQRRGDRQSGVLHAVDLDRAAGADAAAA